MNKTPDEAPNGDSDVLVRVSAIAKYLNLPPNVCQNRIDQKQIPTFKIGRTRCARKSTLDAWMADQERSDASALGPHIV